MGAGEDALRLVLATPAYKRTAAERALYRQFLKDASARAKAVGEARRQKRSVAAKKGARTRLINRAERAASSQGVPSNYFVPLANMIDRGVPIDRAESYIVRLSMVNKLKGRARANAFYSWLDDLSEEYPDYDWEYKRDGFY